MQEDQQPADVPQDDDLANGVLNALLEEPDPLKRYEALTKAQNLYEALAKRIAAERARAVAEMHTSGMSYGRIADVIGFTRARAQQLVERAAPIDRDKQEKRKTAMASQEEITQYLASFTSRWPRQQLHAMFRLPPTWRPVADIKTAEEVASELIADADFQLLRLGNWLETADGQLLTAAVEALMPPLYQRDAELLVEALTLAAKSQQKDGRARAVAGTALAAAGLAIVLGSRGK